MDFVAHKKIDKTKWNEMVAKADNGKITHFSWYLDEVCPNWNALVNEDYSMMFPLPEKSKLGFKYLIQPFLVQQLGLIYCQKGFQCKIALDECLDYVKDNYRLFNFNINTASTVLDGIVSRFNNNLVLYLDSEYDEIVSGFSTNLKRNIKKMRQSNMTISRAEHYEEIVDLFVRNKGKEVGWNRHKTCLLLKVLNVIKQNADIDVRTVYDGEELVCGALFVGYNGRWTFLFSGNSQKGKDIGAMAGIIDSFIEDRCNSSELLDFEGSNDEGLFRFYMSFNAVNEHYTTIKSKLMNILKR